jgi:hypothetical protein
MFHSILADFQKAMSHLTLRHTGNVKANVIHIIGHNNIMF